MTEQGERSPRSLGGAQNSKPTAEGGGGKSQLGVSSPPIPDGKPLPNPSAKATQKNRGGHQPDRTHPTDWRGQSKRARTAAKHHILKEPKFDGGSTRQSEGPREKKGSEEKKKGREKLSAGVGVKKEVAGGKNDHCFTERAVETKFYPCGWRKKGVRPKKNGWSIRRD